MELEKENKAASHFMLEVTPEMLVGWSNTLQLKRQTTMPGQSILLQIAPGFTFCYVPEGGKKILGSPSPASDAATKGYVDKAVSV